MAIHIRRRVFIIAIALSSAAFGRPLAARAQQPEKLPLVGVLSATPPQALADA